MEDKKTVIIGLHDRVLSKTYGACLSRLGFTIKSAYNQEEMIELAEANPDTCAYVMDINLSFPRSPSPASCIQVYAIMREGC